MNLTSPWKPYPTRDGSYTFFSNEFQEAFHSHEGAITEAFQKFVRATQVDQKAKCDRINLLDICYGLGYNTAAALEAIWSINPTCHVTVYALELDANVPAAAIATPLIERWSPAIQTVLRAIAQTRQCLTNQLTAYLLLGDARKTIQSLTKKGYEADAIFLDPFSPRRCPQLWTVEFIQQLAQCLAPTGRIATYSRSASVRSALKQANLHIGTIPLEPNRSHFAHEWSQGTIAAHNSDHLVTLSPMEREHLHTRAAIPYRDPTLTNSAAEILNRHHIEQQASTYESTTRWRRRWGIR